MTAFETFVRDKLRQEVWLAEIEPRLRADPSTTAMLRYSLGTFRTTALDTPASELYTARLVEEIDFEFADVQPGTLGIQPPPQLNQIRLGNRAGDLDALHTTYLWDGAKVTLRLAGYSPRLGRALTYAESQVLATAEAVEILPGLDEIAIPLRQRTEPWEQPLAFQRYRGQRYAIDFLSTTAGGVNFGDDATAAKLNLRGDLSIDFWIYVKSIPGNRRVVGWEHATSNMPWRMALLTTGAFRFSYNSGGAQVNPAADSPTVQLNRWVRVHHSIDTAAMKYAWAIYDSVTGAWSTSSGTYTGAASRPSPAVGLRCILSDGGTGASGSFMVQDVAAHSTPLVNLSGSTADFDRLKDRGLRPLTADEYGDAACALYVPFDDGSATDKSASPLTPAFLGVAGTDYTFTASGEGAEDLAGQPKPDAFGEYRQAEPVLVDPTLLVYQIHSAVSQSVTEVADGGAPLILDTTFTDWRSFAAAAPPAAGKYHLCNAASGTYVRPKTKPSLAFTVSGEGDASDTGYVATIAGITQRILTQRCGLQTSELDTSSFATADTDQPAVVGWYVREEATARAVIDPLLVTGGFALFAIMDGTLRIRRLVGTTGPDVTDSPVLTLTEQDIVNWDPVSVEGPIGAARIGYSRCWRPLSTEEVSAWFTEPQPTKMQPILWTTMGHRAATKRAHPRCRTLSAESAFATLAAAEGERERQLDLFGGDPRGIRLTCALRAAVLNRLDLVEIDYRDFSANGRGQSRLFPVPVPGSKRGSYSPMAFRVLGVGVRGEGREATLYLWREDSV